ncbi:MAG: hypothetical protein RLN90_04245 [Balneolaceae bacterium]
MLNIIRYTFYDLLRSRWSITYMLFFMITGFALLFLSNDLGSAIISLMNILLVLAPLVGIIFGVIFYYNSSDFSELLLSQPLKRSTIFLGQLFGICISLSLSLIIGLGVPFLVYGLFGSNQIFDFLVLILDGVILTFVFVGLAYFVAMKNDNKVKGFGYALLMWLIFAILYDGLLLILLVQFEEYPLDTFSLIATVVNPIDLSRILILLKLDISALMGYTGALYQKFFGTLFGLFISFGLLSIWSVLPGWMVYRTSKHKDF